MCPFRSQFAEKDQLIPQLAGCDAVDVNGAASDGTSLPPGACYWRQGSLVNRTPTGPVEPIEDCRFVVGFTAHPLWVPLLWMHRKSLPTWNSMALSCGWVAGPRPRVFGYSGPVTKGCWAGKDKRSRRRCVVPRQQRVLFLVREVGRSQWCRKNRRRPHSPLILWSGPKHRWLIEWLHKIIELLTH